MYRKSLDFARRGVLVASISAIDIALWDIKGKLLGLSVGELLGGVHRENIVPYATGMYFTDKARGAVLRLSMDGLTPISNVGMRSFFRDELKLCESLTGTFDSVAGEYNLSLYRGFSSSTTRSISFNEAGKGWVSFKSFIPELHGSRTFTFKLFQPPLD